MTPTQRFAVLLALIPISAAVFGWLINRAARRYDAATVAREESREKLDEERRQVIARHAEANHLAVAALSADLAKSNKEFGDRLVVAQEQTSRAILDMSNRLARIEGRQEGLMTWDGADRRGPRTEGP